jgi:hypothetical protein
MCLLRLDRAFKEEGHIVVHMASGVKILGCDFRREVFDLALFDVICLVRDQFGPSSGHVSAR